MKIGVAYPTREVPGDPVAIRKFVRAAEDLGYSHLMAYDHVIKTPHDNREPKLTGPYTEHDAFQDPFVFFGFVAAISETLELVTGVLCLPQRQTAVVAQQSADVDLLSNQRLRLGVGIGWNYVEFEALGQDFTKRGIRADEQIPLLRKLWTGDVISFEGQFDRIDRGCINPAPRRQIPLWVGGHSEPGYKRGAKFGDGFIFAGTGTTAVEGWARVKFHLNELGRDEQTFGRELLTIFARNPRESCEYLKMFREVGGTHGCIDSMEKGLGNDIDAHIDYIATAKALWDKG